MQTTMAKQIKNWTDLAITSDGQVVPKPSGQSRVPDHVALSWSTFVAKAAFYNDLAAGYEADYGYQALAQAAMPTLQRKLHKLRADVANTERQLGVMSEMAGETK